MGFKFGDDCALCKSRRTSEDCGDCDSGEMFEESDDLDFNDGAMEHERG